MNYFQVCPQCGCDLHRSRSRGLREKIVRTFSIYRAYRCYECGWRGWLKEDNSKKQAAGRRQAVQLVLSLLMISVIILVALYTA